MAERIKVEAPPVGVDPQFDEYAAVEWERYRDLNSDILEGQLERLDALDPEYDIAGTRAEFWRGVEADFRNDLWAGRFDDQRDAQIAELEARNEELQARNDEFQTRVRRTEARYADLEGSRDALIGQLGKMETDNDRLRMENDELSRQVEELEDENETLGEDVGRLWDYSQQVRDQGDDHARKLHDRVQDLEARAYTYDTPEPCPCGGPTLVCQKCGRMPGEP